MNLVHLDCITGIKWANRKKNCNQWWARWVGDRVEKKVATSNPNKEEEKEKELEKIEKS